MLRHAKDVRLSLALSGSLWLSLARCPALSGSLSGSLWLSLARCPALSGSLWLTLAHSGSLPDSLWLPLALSGSLRLSLALFCSPNLLTKPLLGSQGPCSARNAVPEFPHFNQPCSPTCSFECSQLFSIVQTHSRSGQSSRESVESQ